MANKIAEFMFQQTGISNLGKFLDISAFRHKLVSSNIANVSTPGYRSRDIDFHSEFRRVTGDQNRLTGTTTQPGHIPLGNHPQAPPDVKEARVMEGDLNAVDPDREISRLAQNELIYSVGARLLKNKFDALRKVITSK